MKLKYFRITLLIAIATSSLQINSDLFLSAQLTPEHTQGVKNLTDTVATYPLTVVTADGTLQQGIQNRTIKAMTPPGTWPILAHGNFTVLKPKPTAFQSYPSGATIFPGYPDVAAKFDAMIASMKDNPGFIPFFRKVHINALNELYHYLMSIYTNFNLQHAGTIVTPSGKMQVSISKFLNDEQLYDANKKTLIINHLINIIESQFNGAIRSYIPKIPQTFASFMGKTLIQNDYSIDLTHFMVKQIEPELKAYKKQYLQALAAYLDFYQTYTSYLNKPHPKHTQHFTAFVAIAEDINQFIYGDSFADTEASKKLTATDKELIAVQKMDPPLFCFGYDDMRALKLIPHLAKSISKSSKLIMWPDHIVEIANEGGVINGHPMAYFKNSEGKVVKGSQSDPTNKLFLCMQSGANSFEEELIAQPDWLNSWEGVSRILSACFGDFSALLGLNIFDPCMESLIENVVATKNGTDPNETNVPAGTCKALMESWKKEKVAIPSLPPVALTPNILGPQQHPANATIYTQSNLIPTLADITPQLGVK
ncbi:MAG: hypothetical protein NTZ68_02630 [Candidatus Dependentiae bacterium]|nr:hypothetical protein [Candidatus Dependentiae bacterium]